MGSVVVGGGEGQTLDLGGLVMMSCMLLGDLEKPLSCIDVAMFVLPSFHHRCACWEVPFIRLLQHGPPLPSIKQHPVWSTPTVFVPSVPKL